ncbi:antitoxin VbhA family protein [Deinococcus koreensis]|uniref:Antitoxin VbhA domain-containing protein n=1 Tax=Deinococcus koreensis TaxID=2054903 RepID=A0A2K3URP8_9DEIO|nr:antitoxin VbhA family protein [Deinococcus koreensis]PNY79213.1 hypothetical protein CVO96_20060 [Deinococcus koreensis]
MTHTATRPKITPQERARRQDAVKAGRSSVRLEGFVLDETVEAIYARFVEGELELPEMIAQVRAHAGLAG